MNSFDTDEDFDELERYIIDNVTTDDDDDIAEDVEQDAVSEGSEGLGMDIVCVVCKNISECTLYTYIIYIKMYLHVCMMYTVNCICKIFFDYNVETL